jgi:hypothetical protein
MDFNSPQSNYTKNTSGNFALPIGTGSSAIPNKPLFTLEVFGLQALKKALLDKSKLQYNSDEQIRVTRFGSPVYEFCDVRLKGKVLNPSVTFQGEQELELILDTALINISMYKNIVTTQLQGRDGTVKEYIAKGDYSISIKGVLDSGDMSVYPRQAVENLKTLLDLNTNLELISPFAQILGINEVIVQSYTIDQMPTGYNIQPYQINFLSDVPLIIKASNE